LTSNRIGGVMVSVLVSRAVDNRFEPDRVTPKTLKLVFVAYVLKEKDHNRPRRTCIASKAQLINHLDDFNCT
jgi:hypothetical protein